MEFTRGPIIGRGATATVSLAIDTLSGELFAVKSAELSSSDFLQKEQSFLSKLASQSIVKYLGFSIARENNTPMYNLHIEYFPNGSLFDAIRAKGKLDESTIKLYTYQILQGLDHLHQNGVAHCDIKTRNVLIGDQGAKIADLGCAKSAREFGWDTSKISGTPAYLAPEAARGLRQGFEADVWALGCVIVEMANGVGAWPEMGDSPVLSALYRIGFSGLVPEFPGWFSEQGKDFLSKCLERDWRKRWTVKELLKHPFLAQQETNPGLVISPSSVLEINDLWGLLEVCEGFEEEQCFDCDLNSAEERIKILIGKDSIFIDDDNDDDEQWLTIRDNEICEDNNQRFLEIVETSIVYDDDLEEEGASDGFMFSRELLFGSINSFSYTSSVMPCNNNVVDSLSELNNKDFLFGSILVLLFYQFKLSPFNMLS